MNPPSFAGHTVLVIAGGPSVPSDLARLTEPPEYVLSANAHGFFQEFFVVDAVVATLEYHVDGGISMERYLRQFTAPIICPFFWADIRLRDFPPLRLDTGLTAIAVAAWFGAARIISTGIDGFEPPGKKYFHGIEQVKRTDVSRIGNTWKALYLKEWLNENAPYSKVLPMSGYLTKHFEEWKK